MMNEIKNYWNDKNYRSKIAESHYKEMTFLFYGQIEDSYNNSKIYKFPGNIIQTETKCITKPEILLKDYGTVEAILEFGEENNKMAALNFASFKNPGGGFLRGSCAQEECLCHASFLYNVLEKFKSSFYDKHIYTNNGMYYNEGIYSPNIIFNKNTKCNIITVAAPNKSILLNYDKGSEKANSEALKERIRFIFEIAKTENIETLILGAFGCGVFMQDPNEVAQCFKDNVENYDFGLKKVIFAVPDNKFKNNYKVFNQFFGG